jgi:hypothetical protein
MLVKKLKVGSRRAFHLHRIRIVPYAVCGAIPTTWFFNECIDHTSTIRLEPLGRAAGATCFM